MHRVIARTAVERVVARTAEKRVPAVGAEERVVAVEAMKGAVLRAARRDDVCKLVAGADRGCTGKPQILDVRAEGIIDARFDRIDSCACGLYDEIVPIVDGIEIVARAARERIAAASPDQRIVAAAAEKRVIAADCRRAGWR